MTLDQLRPGTSAKIDSIGGGELSLRKHLLDMGLTVGTDVTCTKDAGSVIEIRVRGFELALRKDDAAKISVSDITEGEREYHHAHAERLIERIKNPSIDFELNKKNLNEIIKEGEPINIALIGNQNCGKTTLFNQLTGANQKVGRFEGVTVERKDGPVHGHHNVTITDLPAIYSLSPFTQEEVVARDFVLNEKPDCLINIIDASNIQRNFYLTTQLLSMEVPMVIALNMIDEVQKNGGFVDINMMSAILGVPVVPISALKNQGLDELIKKAIFVARYGIKPRTKSETDWKDPESDAIHKCLRKIIGIIGDRAKESGISARFAATKLIEYDEFIQKKLRLSDAEIDIIEKTVKAAEEETNADSLSMLSEMRFRFINMLYSKTVVYPKESVESIRSRKIDKILTGKYTAIPAFIGIMAIIFYLTFGPLGTWLSDVLELGIEHIISLADGALTAYGINPVVHSLIIEGAMAGIGSILSFMPIIVLLFFFLSILEDCGYISRVAFIMDGILRKIGLSGRSIVPMLIGFGCSVPAIMASRTLPSNRDRKMTILLIPFMSCSAKLPIYTLLTAAFFPEHGAIVMLGLYFGSIVVGILYALALGKTVFRGEPVPFVMELPNYRIPAPKNVMQIVGEQVKDFITKAFTVIFAASVIIWFLQTFDARFNLVTDSSNSMLAALGGILAPIFAPMGLGDWRVSTALITGFTAKESVVSTLLVLVGGSADNLGMMFTPATALVFLTFALLYAPCASAIAAVNRELGGKWAVALVGIQCAIAWVVSFLVSLLLRAAGMM